MSIVIGLQVIIDETLKGYNNLTVVNYGTASDSGNSYSVILKVVFLTNFGLFLRGQFILWTLQ